MHIARRFEVLLEAYRRPDGGRWGGADLAEATGGVVGRSYVTNLRKGRIESPGYDKLRAIARAMQFPPELWFSQQPLAPTSRAAREATEAQGGVPERLQYLFDTVPNERTGRPYTDAEVAKETAGLLTEEQVKAMRMGQVTDPSVDQVLSLAEVFGVEASFFLEQRQALPLLDAEILEALKDEKVSAIAHRSMRLDGREQDMILAIIEQFEGRNEAEDGR